MQLSLHAEYALRVLLYLASRPEDVVSTKEISGVFSISKNHLVRVMETLGEHGYLHLVPGRGGGVSLAMDIHSIRLGDVVRKTEPNFRIAECFDAKRNTCAIAPICSLKPVLNEALDSFLTTLNRYTLADLMTGGAQRRISRMFSILAARGIAD